MTALLWLTVAVPLEAAVLVRIAPVGNRLLTGVGAAVAAAPAWMVRSRRGCGRQLIESQADASGPAVALFDLVAHAVVRTASRWRTSSPAA